MTNRIYPPLYTEKYETVENLPVNTLDRPPSTAMIFYLQKTCDDGTILMMRFVTHPEYVWIENLSTDTNVEVKGKNWKHHRVFEANSLENFVVSYAREIWNCMVEDGWRYV